MKTLWALMLFAVIPSSGCASLPQPTPPDVVQAKERWPEATLGSLEAGRRAFVSYCSGCHSLPLPSSRSPDNWLSILEEMHDEAKVPPSDRPLIDQFVVTLSERPSAAR